jgi:hypothetical protein
MTDATNTDEVDALRRPFKLGLLAVAIVFVLAGGLIAAFGTGRDRVEGSAEHWLTDISDTTRKGVAADARERAEKIGPMEIADQILPPGTNTDGKAAFTDIEVGAARTADVVYVPFRVRIRDANEDVRGALAMTKAPDGWKVTGLAPAASAGKVASEGGDPVANAALPLYAGAIAVGAAITAAASMLVRRAGPAPAHV